MDVKFCDVCSEVIKNLPEKPSQKVMNHKDFETKMMHLMGEMMLKLEPVRDKYVCTMELCPECKLSFKKACNVWEVVRKKDKEGSRWQI